MNRRGFLTSCLALSAAPAIVRAESLMKLWVPPQGLMVEPNTLNSFMHSQEFTSSTWTKVNGIRIRSVFVFNSALTSEELRRLTR